MLDEPKNHYAGYALYTRVAVAERASNRRLLRRGYAALEK